MYKDLQEFIDDVQQYGDLKIIEGADWDLELGLITELTLKRPGVPLVLFDKIKGYECRLPCPWQHGHYTETHGDGPGPVPGGRGTGPGKAVADQDQASFQTLATGGGKRCPCRSPGSLTHPGDDVVPLFRSRCQLPSFFDAVTGAPGSWRLQW